MKRTKIKRRPLADTVLENLEPEESEYRELDSPGLYFRVRPNGSKSWNLRYKRPNGKWAWKGLGRWPQVSGRAARARAEELLERAGDGEDLAKVGEDIEQTLFRAFAEDWLARKAAEGLADKTLRMMRDGITKDFLPDLGDTPIHEITRADCARVIEQIEDRGAWQVARKARGWLDHIFGLAIARGYCELNPASELARVARKAPEVKHHPHLLEPELPAFLRALDRSNSTFVTRTAVQMLLLTAARPGMVRFAEWEEVDLDTGQWTVPAGKMKRSRDIVIPLPRQLVYALNNLIEITGRCKYLFPGAKDPSTPLAHTAINMALGLVGYKGKLVGHGARHTASTLLREHGWRKEYVEMQLSHVEGGVAGVYNKAQYLQQRAVMMQWYADYLDALKAGITDEQRERFAGIVIR